VEAAGGVGAVGAAEAGDFALYGRGGVLEIAVLVAARGAFDGLMDAIAVF
jgi:hypothetical protein